MPPIRNPSLEEFLTHARQASAFLIEEFAFQEQTGPRHADMNDYQARYVNATTLVSVEGMSLLLLTAERQTIGLADFGPHKT